CAGRRGRRVPDDLAWHRLRRAIPLRRHRVRPHAHPRDRRLWRAGQPDAALRDGVHGLHHGQCRLARHLRLHRRVHDAARHLQGRDPRGVLRDNRRDPVGVLRAVALPQDRVRCAGQAVADDDQGHDLPRVPHPVPAGGADHPVRRLSEAGARHVGRLGGATRQQLFDRDRGREGCRADPLGPSPMSFESAGYQLLPVLPELVLAVGAMVLLLIGAWRGQGTTALVTTLAIVLLVVTGVLEWMLPAGKLVSFGGSFIVDSFARFLKITALIGSAATLILSREFLSDPSRRIFEYAILVLLSTLGMMVLISAGDLIT